VISRFIIINPDLFIYRVVLFMHNQDIDHLYSLALADDAGTQQFGQFGINSIRMKSSLGIAGHVIIYFTI
jgi:hypothetical protein